MAGFMRTIMVLIALAVILGGAYMWFIKPSDPITVGDISARLGMDSSTETMTDQDKTESTKPETISTPPTNDPKPAADNPLLQPGEHDIILGDEDAPVTIIEYASLSCHHCASFHKDTYPELKSHFVEQGKVRFIFRHFPLNEAALAGSKLSMCVGDDKYYEMIALLMDTQSEWANGQNFMEKLQQKAVLAGLSKEKFDSCMKDKEIENILLSSRQQGAQGLNVASTPTLFVNGRMVKGAQNFKTLSGIIGQAEQEAEGS